MTTALLTVAYFLVGVVSSLVLLLLWSRFFLRYLGVSSLHPIGRTIFNLTNPVFLPLENRLYTQKKIPRYDWLGLGGIALVECLKFILLGFLAYKTLLPAFYLFLFVVADFIVQPCNLLFYALLIQIIMSWVNPQWAVHPLCKLIHLLTLPLIRLGHKIIPNGSGFDFGPLVSLILLKVITLFISSLMPLPLL